MKISNADNLNIILKECNFIITHTKRKRYSTFLKDVIFFNGICFTLEIIGEVCKYLTNNIKEQILNINWIEYKNLRNDLLHSNNELDHQRIWSIVKIDIPKLMEAILTYLESNNLLLPYEKEKKHIGGSINYQKLEKFIAYHAEP